MEESGQVEILPLLVPFVIVVFIIAIGVVLLNLQFRKNIYKKQLEQELLTKEHQEKILETSLQVQEEERKRIAQNIHDELGAALSIGRMQLVQLEKSDTVDTDKIKSVRELLENTLANARRISHELAPLNLQNLGLEKALRSLLDKAEETGNLNTRLQTSNTDNLNELVQLELYRICSELINNTLKYANASEINIEIDKREAQVYCFYTDNGTGLDPNQVTKGLGFRSIENRISTLKGALEHGNGKKGGYFAKFSFPDPSKTQDI